MNKFFTLPALLVACGACMAADVGRVTSSTPVVQQVAVPHRVCSTDALGVQQCTQQTVYEDRTVGYNVVYEFAGKQYAAQLPQDPGPTVALQVSPVGAPAPVVVPAPVVYSPAPATVVVPAQPVYVQPYYPPVTIGLGLGFGFGYWGHRHWR